MIQIYIQDVLTLLQDAPQFYHQNHCASVGIDIAHLDLNPAQVSVTKNHGLHVLGPFGAQWALTNYEPLATIMRMVRLVPLIAQAPWNLLTVLFLDEASVACSSSTVILQECIMTQAYGKKTHNIF